MAKSDNKIVQTFLTLFLYLLVLLILGASGYMLIEGWSLPDAIYMTFIALSTVGFHEVGSLGPYGRIVTMFVVLFGLVLISMLSASVTSLLVSRELIPGFKTRKMKKKIKQLQGHTVLCGAGETGETIITEFIAAQKPLVVIDRKSDTLERLSDIYPSFLVVMGDATKDETLLEANITKASSLITVLSEDADNLFVVISARSICPELDIVARAVDPHTQGKMYTAGANNVISPNVTEGLRMAAMILRPTVMSFLDVMMQNDEMAFRLEEITVPEGSAFDGKKLMDIEIPKRTGLIVIAIQKKSNGKPNLLYNPQSSTVITDKDKFVVLGNTEGIERLQKIIRS